MRPRDDLDIYIAERMADPEFAAAYRAAQERARAEWELAERTRDERRRKRVLRRLRRASRDSREEDDRGA